MVQVDVFWSYGIGSGFALAAAEQLAARRRAEPEAPLLENPFFTRALLFLAILFAPSGLCLLWAFPSWETMHVGDKSLPAWLVTGFGVTNITQGILGFAIADWLVRRGRRYLAFLQPAVAYFGMFFILVHGWDGTGYRRFFSVDRAAFEAWAPSNVSAWLGSDVALTLYGMGVVLLPVMLYWTGVWFSEGQRMVLQQDGSKREGIGAWQAVACYLLLVFGLGLGGAIGASLLVHALGWWLGIALFMTLAAVLLLSRYGAGRLLFGRMILETATRAPPESASSESA